MQRIVGFDLGPMNEFGSFPEHNGSFGHASEGLLSHVRHLTVHVERSPSWAVSRTLNLGYSGSFAKLTISPGV